MTPTISITLAVSSAAEAIEAYRAITAACGTVASVSVQPPVVQSSGCNGSPVRTSEEQQLRDKYRFLHPDGKGFRLTKLQALNCKNGIKPIEYLRLAVQQMEDGTFVAPTLAEESETDTSLADGSDIY